MPSLPKLLGKLVDLPFRIKRKFHRIMGTQRVRTRYGVIMRANWSDATFRMCYAGSYGTALADLISLRRRDFLFLDIGANQGLYSLLAARNPFCRHAYAFEPVPGTFSLLHDNIAANLVSARITAIDAAVSAKTGEAKITMRPEHSGSASLDNATFIHGGTEETIRTIDISGIDSLLPSEGEILVKIDVEGHEMVVIDQLLSSRHLQRIAAIFYEVDEDWNDPAILETRLRAGGFSKFVRYGTGKHYDILALRGEP